MVEDAAVNAAGWSIGTSAVLEVEYALAIAGGHRPLDALSPPSAELLRAVSADWREEWPRLLGEPRSSVSVLEHAASLADVLAEESYDRATLVIRELSLDEALARVVKHSAGLGLEPRLALAPRERLVDLASRLVLATYSSLGFEFIPDGEFARRLARETAWLPRILPGGDLYAPFWHWLDRFYYEFYLPWRGARADALSRSEKRALLALGARGRTGEPPSLEWLPPQNPLLRYAELRDAVAAGKLRVLFWLEPFGLADAWTLQPGLVVVSCSESGALSERFEAVAEDVASRARALSDPTRLKILRLIRSFGMVNTEIADYLQLARPTVSIHAKVLREAGLIRSRQEGRLVRHEMVPSEVRRLFRDLEQLLGLPEEE